MGDTQARGGRTARIVYSADAARSRIEEEHVRSRYDMRGREGVRA